MLDISDLKSLLSDEDIIDYLGLESKNQGGRLSVLCPFHHDRHFGSAYLQNGYFTCFACGEKMDIIEMTKRLKGLTFSETLKELASLAGVQINNTNGENEINRYSKFRLSKDEIEALQIETNGISLKELFCASEYQYKRIISERALTQMNHYQYILDNYSTRTSPKAYDIYQLYNGCISADTYRIIKQEAKKRLRTCKILLERFSE